MLEEIGVEDFFNKIDEFEGNEFLENLSKTKNQDFYGSRQKYTEIETLGKVKKESNSVLMEIIQLKFIVSKIII